MYDTVFYNAYNISVPSLPLQRQRQVSTNHMTPTSPNHTGFLSSIIADVTYAENVLQIVTCADNV
jgi:hypothetical protein